MGSEIVFALYRPNKGKDTELEKLIAQHGPTLRRLELITDRPVVLVKSKNGTYIEIFEWRTEESAGLAHHHPEVAKIWEAMGKIADLPTIDSLEEISERFPHFQPINL
ncbi:MAG TPA: hypothetical protein VLH08_09585 [Acidobacteriota bacterium]|nr:hypothetical protein [Acidobacteriota bacterium]